MIAAQQAEANELVDALARILDAQAAARQVLDALNRWPHGGSLIGIRMRPGHPHPDAIRQRQPRTVLPNTSQTSTVSADPAQPRYPATPTRYSPHSAP